MTVPVSPTVEWISQCYTHQSHHEHVSLYLLREDDKTILIDSGSFYHRSEIIRSVDTATGGDGPDAIVLSHSDYPHAANVSPLGGESDTVELVASSGAPSQQGLPNARKCTIGGQLEVCGRMLSFIDPPLADRSHTTWIYDHTDSVLFTADGFGNYHEPGQCEYRSTDFADMIPEDRIRGYHRDNLVWLRYVDPDKIERTLNDIFDRFEIKAIAPIHGNPIMSEDLSRYREHLYESMRRIADEYEVIPSQNPE